ncbi:ATP-dependent helicase HrpB [Microbacterium indicum]|uniref:ATP-dependent helicase HrpB n=1 Tax=Microbacterium indicum TaxID=358100 RepID=UPI00041C45CE|nr:ATP-dependent helicase HrpB [Microbacterium indicum]
MFDLARIGSGLPVAAARAELESAFAWGAAVITAPPGTGKTTFVPPLVAESADGRVVVTQPRRVAVRAAARRLAHLAGEPLGRSVGFTVRGERKVSDRTRVEFVTPGVLLRRLLRDAALDGVAAVVLDEVHERSIDGDLLLGMLAEVRELRDDLALVAMSATVDSAAIADLLGGAPVVDVPSALHPVEIEHSPAPGPRLGPRGVERDFLAHVARLAVNAQARLPHDALVFVPGAREVDEVVRLIAPLTRSEVLALHGQLPAAQQDRATSGRTSDVDPLRIVVSTALAESSLTVPGVRIVVDAGLSREPRRDVARGMTGLVTVSESKASARQRMGRAGRQGPGLAVRAFSDAEFAAMPAAAAPEIQTADLTDAALTLAAWGAPGGEGLPLLTRPPADAMRQATDALHALDLVDGDGRITASGSRVAAMPVGAREARALLAAGAQGVSAAPAGEVVAALAGGHRATGADLGSLLRGLRSERLPGAARWRAEARRLARFADGDGSADATAIVTALARPEWIARRVADRTYLLASGTRAALPEGSALAGSEWLAVGEVALTAGRAGDRTGAVIRLAAALDPDDALRIGAPLVAETRAASTADGSVRVRLERHLGAIALSSTPVAATDADRARAAADEIRARGIAALPWTERATELRARLALLHRAIGAPWPDVSDDALLARADEWIPVGGLARLDVTAALRALLPWPEAARLDELAPERLAVPSGSSVRIDYASDPDGRPIVAVKLQELFGLADTPRLAGGRAPILFHLLSPARRPLAVTSDLASFWNGPYADVRKEMHGRYPKHPWPEDPWTAPATARTTRGMTRDSR